MAAINQVYGQNFQGEAELARMEHLTKLITSNVAHKVFQLRNNFSSLFQKNNVIKPVAIQQMAKQVQEVSPHLRLVNIPPGSDDLNMLPFFVNGTAEYFALCDLKTNQVVFFYVTPTNMEAF